MRNYEVNRVVENIVGSVGVISKMTMALTVDETKVIPVAGEIGRFTEVKREQSEIDKLSDLAREAVGFDEVRGDKVTVFALRFDKSQEVQAKEEAVSEERKEFWTGIAINVAKVLGIPTWPFFIVGAVLGTLAFLVRRSNLQRAAREKEVEVERAKPEERPEDYLRVDLLEAEIGYQLVPLVDAKQGGDLIERIVQIRKVAAMDMGFIVPPVRVRDNIQYSSNQTSTRSR